MEGELIQQTSNLGAYIISGLLGIGFAYFLYTRFKKSRDKASGGGGGGRSGNGDQQRR